jgi:chloramphenicol 3-O-phosphotransferase
VWIAQVDAIYDMLHCERTLSKEEVIAAYSAIIQQLNTLLRGFAETDYAIIVDQVFEQDSWLVDCLASLSQRKPILIGIHCDLASIFHKST